MNRMCIECLDKQKESNTVHYNQKEVFCDICQQNVKQCRLSKHLKTDRHINKEKLKKEEEKGKHFPAFIWFYIWFHRGLLKSTPPVPPHSFPHSCGFNMRATGQEVPCSVVLTARTDLDTHPGELLLLARGMASLGALTALAASMQHGRKPFLYTVCSQTIPPLDRFSSFCPATS